MVDSKGDRRGVCWLHDSDPDDAEARSEVLKERPVTLSSEGRIDQAENKRF